MSQRLISADDHVDLSHDKIRSFLDPKYHAAYTQALKDFAASMGGLRSNESNQRWREQEGQQGPAKVGIGTGGNGFAGCPGHTDAAARLADMDADGVAASSTYCEVSAFRYLYLVKDGWQEATRAFNTALSDFASPAPERLIVSFQIPIHDIDTAVAEVKWAASVGCKSLQLPVFPAELGLPDYWDRRYDPLWRAISDAGLPICCHIGLNTQLESLALRDPTPQKGIFVPMVALSSAEALGMWVLTGVLERFPELKVVFVEPGVGWVAWWLHTVDDLAARQGYEFPGLKKAPSEYFRQSVSVTFIDEPGVLTHAHDIVGINNVMWSSDYPHPVTSWPHSRSVAEEVTKGLPAAERELVLHGNAARIWNL
jgi:predicted TIM-barrel fold metal-dependent hydrolase